VHKVQHNPRNKSVRDTILLEQKGLECAEKWCTGLSCVPPDNVRCTKVVQMSTSHSREFGDALRYNSPDCPVCHRTVRCAIGLSGEPAEQRLSALTVDSAECDSDEQCHDRVESAEVRAHQTVWCGTGLSGAAKRQTSPTVNCSEP
jgi:hypothetical protein